MKLETTPSPVQNTGLQRHAVSFIPRMMSGHSLLRFMLGTLPCIVLAMGVASSSRAQPAPPAAALDVVTVTVNRQSIVLTTELTGRTSPFLIAEIRPQINGLIQKRLFVEGSDVKAGQELYQIDPAPFQAALDNANAALGRAEAHLPAMQSRADRFKQALVEKAVSQQDYDDADAALKQALADIQFYKAAVTTARINLDYAHIVSPISGRIGKSTVTDGAIVTAYQPTPLATIQQLDPIYVDVPQSTTELLRLQRRLEDGRLNPGGTNASQLALLLADRTAYPLEGILQFRDVSVDPTTASVILRAIFPNPKGTLLPNMFVRAVIKEGINDQAILIPQQAVMRDPKGNPYVLVVDASSTAQKRPLVIERAIDDKWLVSSGLAQGDRIIVENLQRVRPGMPVREVPSDARGKAGAPSPAGATQAAPQSH